MARTWRTLIRLSLPNPSPLSLFSSIFSRRSAPSPPPPISRADDEPMDPKRELEDRCKAPCTRPLKEYQACSKRIEGDESGQKHCTGQYFDYWRCVDKCVATKLFTYLK